MRRGKFRFLLVSMLVASGLALTGGEVPAATFSFKLTTSPATLTSDPTTQVYTFRFEPDPGTLAIANIDLEIPAGINIREGAFSGGGGGTANFTVSISGTAPLSGEVYGIGIGDYGTKFGVGDTRYRVMKINTPSMSTSFSLVLTISNQTQLTNSGKFLGSEMGTVLVKAGNGSNTQPFSPVDTPAIVTPTGPSLSNIWVSPNPVQPPYCATVTWNNPEGAAVTINTNPPTPADNITVNSTNTSALACLDTGIYVLTITASLNGKNTTGTTTLVVSPPPLIETTCKQIRKNPLEGNPSCIYLCLNTIDGSRQDIQSATWYNNATCDNTVSPGIPLAIYGVDSPETTLVCAPCRIDVDQTHPQACTPRTVQSDPPFRFVVNIGGVDYYRNCDVFRFEHQDQGFAAVLGNDPWIVVNGRQVWVK